LQHDDNIDGNLAKAFGRSAARPPLVDGEAYGALLEKLLAEGRGYGKTESVAAYRLRNLQIVSEDEDGNEQGKSGARVEPLYIVMDTKYFPNEYARSLVMQDIAMHYARRIIGEEDVNGHDYKGPGIWTSKTAAFEFDYKRREGLDETGKPLNIYDPDPDAYRLCLKVPEGIRIPTAWGEPWHLKAGGTLAVRERDIPALAEALQSIRDGKATPEEALFDQKPDGKRAARFDVYGMNPGFLEENYKPVFLKEATQKLMRTAAAPVSATATPAKVIPLGKPA